jgi:uncharacterized membrane protein YeaQ/YmgE (transglycosylase-associated protein family)
MTAMGIVLYMIIIGAAAGFLATRIMDVRTDMVTTVGIGILGAIIGGLVLRFLLTIMGALSGFVGAILGALLLIWIWQTYVSR